MAVDLNSVAKKLKSQRSVGVTKDGQLTDKDPRNDGTRATPSGQTTLEPQRFYVT